MRSRMSSEELDVRLAQSASGGTGSANTDQSATAAAVQTWATALQRAEAADMHADAGGSEASSADDGAAPRGNTASAFEARLDASLYAAHLAQAMLARPNDAPPLQQPLSGPVPEGCSVLG